MDAQAILLKKIRLANDHIETIRIYHQWRQLLSGIDDTDSILVDIFNHAKECCLSLGWPYFEYKQSIEKISDEHVFNGYQGGTYKLYEGFGFAQLCFSIEDMDGIHTLWFYLTREEGKDLLKIENSCGMYGRPDHWATTIALQVDVLKPKTPFLYERIKNILLDRKGDIIYSRIFTALIRKSMEQSNES